MIIVSYISPQSLTHQQQTSIRRHSEAQLRNPVSLRSVWVECGPTLSPTTVITILIYLDYYSVGYYFKSIFNTGNTTNLIISIQSCLMTVLLAAEDIGLIFALCSIMYPHPLLFCPVVLPLLAELLLSLSASHLSIRGKVIRKTTHRHRHRWSFLLPAECVGTVCRFGIVYLNTYRQIIGSVCQLLPFVPFPWPDQRSTRGIFLTELSFILLATRVNHHHQFCVGSPLTHSPQLLLMLLMAIIIVVCCFFDSVKTT